MMGALLEGVWQLCAGFEMCVCTFDLKVALGALALHLDDPVPFGWGLAACALEEGAAQQHKADDG